MNQEKFKLFGNGIVQIDSSKEPRFPGVDESWVYDSETNNYRPAPNKPVKTDNIKI